jgi:FKBP-type peptidyl-prolyl cis-trans isomerase FklB
MQVAFSEISQRLQKAQEEAAEAASAEGNAFLAENAKREGVVTTESGLQYEIINEGSGEKPSYDSNVRTHYHGTFIDGKVFDSSVTRGQPAEFPVSGVIAGWTEALQLMPVGAKYKLYVPHHLAYGERGAGAAIPPYSTLVFEVELLDIL